MKILSHMRVHNAATRKALKVHKVGHFDTKKRDRSDIECDRSDIKCYELLLYEGIVA